MRARSLLRVGGVIGAAALTLGLAAPASHAGRATVEKFEAPYILLIDNVVAGPPGTEQAILVANGRVEEGCEGEARPGQFRRVTIGEPPDEGARVFERSVESVDLYLYDSGGLIPPDWTDLVCQADTPPEPFAAGRGVARNSDRFDFVGGDGPDATLRSAVNGFVRTDDGDRWLVKGRFKLTSTATDFDVESSLRIVG